MQNPSFVWEAGRNGLDACRCAAELRTEVQIVAVLFGLWLHFVGNVSVPTALPQETTQ